MHVINLGKPQQQIQYISEVSGFFFHEIDFTKKKFKKDHYLYNDFMESLLA